MSLRKLFFFQILHAQFFRPIFMAQLESWKKKKEKIPPDRLWMQMRHWNSLTVNWSGKKLKWTYPEQPTNYLPAAVHQYIWYLFVVSMCFVCFFLVSVVLSGWLVLLFASFVNVSSPIHFWYVYEWPEIPSYLSTCMNQSILSIYVLYSIYLRIFYLSTYTPPLSPPAHLSTSYHTHRTR